MSKRLLVIVMAVCASPLAAQQDDVLAAADSLMNAGEFERAEALFDAYLADHPASARALIGRGTVRSWSGRYRLALDDFDAVLGESPGDPGALVGAAYAHLWSGEFERGEAILNRILQDDPESVEAAKGLGYAALWAGDAPRARARFEALVARHPDLAEAHVALGQSLVAQGRSSEALQAVAAAERLDPGRDDVRVVRRTAYRMPAPIDLSVTVGRTAFDQAGSGATVGIAVRSVEATARPTGSLTLFGQYDNGIGIDTRALALNDQSVPTWRGGGLISWGGSFVTRAGGGARKLPGGTWERLAEVDQVVVVGPVGFSAGWTGVFRGTAPGEQAMRLGVNVAPALGWELGAAGHVRDVDAGARGLTGVLTLTRTFDRAIDVMSGVAFGRAAGTGGDQNDVFVHLVARPWSANGLTLTLRRQFGDGVEPFTMLAAGVSLALGRS